MDLFSNILSIANNYHISRGVVVYDGMSELTMQKYECNIAALAGIIRGQPQLFTIPKSSTITASGLVMYVNPDGSTSPLHFLEKDIIEHIIRCAVPLPDTIQLVGCNYGEYKHPNYVPPKKKGASGRGRKPKLKKKRTRRTQGNGRYMFSQLTIEVVHPVSRSILKIKVFRTGVIQCPGVVMPNLQDLVDAIQVVQEYLSSVFGRLIKMSHVVALMRNYIWRMRNFDYHISLERLVDIIRAEKRSDANLAFLDYMIADVPDRFRGRVRKFIGDINPMNIAEVTYNKDRCFYLLIKFWRATPHKKARKLTCKLMKSGRLNFDGGLTSRQLNEVFLWLQDLYYRNAHLVIFDINHIVDHSDEDTSDCDIEPIYDLKPVPRRTRKRRTKKTAS